MIARTCIAPIERIKILFQIQKGSSSYVKLLTDVLKKEGIKSMWKGNSAAVIRVIPYTSIQFSSFEEYSTVLRKFESLPKTPRDLTAGSLAGLTACATTYPLDVVRARMALQNEGLANTRFGSRRWDLSLRFQSQTVLPVRLLVKGHHVVLFV